MNNALPVNIELLVVEPKDLARLGKITEQQIFGIGNNFHPQGLFSTEIFGAVGSQFRSKVFGYIDMNTELIHPVVYNAIVNCKAFYKQIMDGKVTAVWNAKLGEFEKSNDADAQTGYSFFISHLTQLKFEKNESDKRNFYIDLTSKAIKENRYLLRYVLVMPAGMRDYTVTPEGKPEEDEINTFYRKLLTQSQLVDAMLIKKTPSLYDSVVQYLQNTLNDLFEYIESLLNGKNKLILGKWLSRKIFNSTRNVLTASVDNTTDMHDPNRLRSNDTAVGLYQFLRSVAPKSLHAIKTTYVSKIFTEDNSFAYLTNAKTFKKEEVLSTHIQRDYDRWMTLDGLESVIANFGNLDTRHEVLSLNNGKHVMGLLYKDAGRVKFLQDIAELPEGADIKCVSPITMAEFLYLSVYQLSGALPGFITRYPIQGLGGIYPCWIQLRTTTEIEKVTLLEEDWSVGDKVLSCFPVRGKPFFNGIAVHQSHMALLGADHDGDTISLVGVQTDEAIQEITATLNSKSYYLNNENRLIFSNSSDIVNAVIAFLTSD